MCSFTVCGERYSRVGDLAVGFPGAIRASTSRSRSDSGRRGCSARAAKTVRPRPTIPHRAWPRPGPASPWRRSRRRPPARAAWGEIQPAPEIRSTRVRRRLAPQRLAQLGAGLLAEEEVHQRHVRLVAARQRQRLLARPRAARQRSTHGCSASSSRKPHWTTSWSSTTSTRSWLGAHAVGLQRAPPAARASPRPLRPELHDATALQRLQGGQPQAHPGRRALRRGRRRCAPRARRCPGQLHRTLTRVGRACLSALRSASASTDWASGSRSCGTSTPPPTRPRAAGPVVAGEALELPAQRDAGVQRGRGRADARARRAGRRAPPGSRRRSGARASSPGRAPSRARARRRTAAASHARGSRA